MSEPTLKEASNSLPKDASNSVTKSSPNLLSPKDASHLSSPKDASHLSLPKEEEAWWDRPSPEKPPRDIAAERKAHKQMWATKMKAKETTPDSLYLHLSLAEKMEMLCLISAELACTGCLMKNSREKEAIFITCCYEYWMEYDDEFDDVRLFDWVWERRHYIRRDVLMHNLKFK
eukprot:540760_1